MAKGKIRGDLPARLSGPFGGGESAGEVFSVLQSSTVSSGSGLCDSGVGLSGRRVGC